MSLTERQERGDPLLRDIIHQTTNRARLLEPIALPQLAGPETLITRRLEVHSSGHRSTL